MLGECPVGILLAEPDVQTCGPYLAAVQGLQQRRLVHVAATGDVDDDHAVLHFRDAPGVHQRLVPAGRTQDDDVGLREQLVHRDEVHRTALRALGLVAVDDGEDVHPQGLPLLADHPADAAVADHAHGLALQLEAFGVGLLLPLVLAHGVPGDGDVACAGEEQREGQLRHGVGGGAGRVPDLNARRLGVFDVDVVHAHAGADDELQAASLRRVDLRLLDLRGGPDDHGIEIPKRPAQGVRLVELLHDLIAVLAELRDGGGVHPIGDQNFLRHGGFSFLFTVCSCSLCEIFYGGTQDPNVGLRTSGGSRPGPRRPPWAWRCRWRRAGRRRSGVP